MEVSVMKAEVEKASVGSRCRVDCGLEWGDQAGVWRAWAGRWLWRGDRGRTFQGNQEDLVNNNKTLHF